MGILSSLKKKFQNFFNKTKLTINNKKKTITIGGALTFSALTILLLSLNMYGITLTTYGDITCGKYCSSPIDINVTNYSLCFSPNFRIYFDDPSKIESYTVVENNLPINISGHCFDIGYHKLMLNGVKKIPTDSVKWSVSYGNQNADPLWIGTNNYDEYTTTTENHCINGTCILTMYSGVNYVFEDSIWKNVTDARSLMDKGFGIVYLSQDKDLSLDVTDFNYTTMTVSVQAKAISTISNIPIKVYSPNETKNASELTGDYKKDYSIKSSTNLIFSSSKGVKTQVIPFSLGDILGFGYNSTTITLNESNSGNVGDTRTQETDSTVNINYGISTTSRMGGTSSGKRNYCWSLWNLSFIPAGSTINNANLSFWQTTAFFANNQPVLAYNTSLYNSTGQGPWVEGTLNAVNCTGVGCAITANLTWATQPSLGILQDNITVTTTNTWKYWNVTNAAITTFANTTNKNMSIVLLHNNAVYTDVMIVATKEYTTDTSRRPQLVITYTTIDSTPPTYSTIGVNNTSPSILDQVLFYSNWSDDVALSYSIFSWNATGINCDTWTNLTEEAFTGTWTNYTNQIPATCLGKITGIGWKIYANDSSNNWNSTPATNSFTGGVPDINYTLGPALTTQIMFNQPTTCSEEESNYFIYPANQTSTQGILNLTNNGTATANSFGCILSSAAPSGYIMMIGNTTGNYTIANTANTTVGSSIAQSATIMAWLYLNCTTPSTIWAPNVDCYVTS